MANKVMSECTEELTSKLLGMNLSKFRKLKPKQKKKWRDSFIIREFYSGTSVTVLIERWQISRTRLSQIINKTRR